MGEEKKLGESIIECINVEKIWDAYATAGYKNLYRMSCFKKIIRAYKNLFMPIQAGGTVLDGGCGTGVLFDTILQKIKPRKIVGADLSGEMLKQSQISANKLSNKYKNTTFEFIKFNLLDPFPWSDNTFDAETFGICICYLPKDGWKNAVKEAYRTLKPGGYIYISTFIDKWDFSREVKKHTFSEFLKSPLGCLWGLKLKKYPMLVTEIARKLSGKIYPPIEDFIKMQEEFGGTEIIKKEIFFGAGVVTRAKKL